MLSIHAVILLPNTHDTCRIQYDVDYVHVGYLKEIYRPNDFVVVCHIPELSEADLPTLSLKRK